MGQVVGDLDRLSYDQLSLGFSCIPCKRRWHPDRAGKVRSEVGGDAASLPQRRLRRGLRGTRLFEVGDERRQGLAAGLRSRFEARNVE
jgi:hypothetical protein